MKQASWLEIGRLGATLAALVACMKLLGVATKDDTHQIELELEQLRHRFDVVVTIYEAREGRNIFLWDDEPDTTGNE